MGCKGLLESEFKLQKFSGRRCVELSLVSPYLGTPKLPDVPAPNQARSEKTQLDNAPEEKQEKYRVLGTCEVNLRLVLHLLRHCLP